MVTLSVRSNTVSQTNHVIINQKWRQSLQGITASCGADVGSDHVLAVATLSLKLRKAKGGDERQRRFDTEKLKNTNTRKAFQLNCKTAFAYFKRSKN